jgi:hypothetical protein
MKTNTKIRLLLAALGGSVFSYSDAHASESTGYFFDEGIPPRSMYLEPFGSDEVETDQLEPYHYTPMSMRPGSGPTRRMGLRRATITGIFNPLDDGDLMSIDQQEQGLARIIPISIRKHACDALPAFVNLTVTGFKRAIKEGGVNECSFETFFTFSLVDPDTLQYITRDQRPPRESIAIFGYATDAVEGRDGIINRIKRNIMDEILLIIQSLIAPNPPDEVVLQLEQYVDQQLARIVPSLKRAMFEILRSDMVAEVATGCCGWCR